MGQAFEANPNSEQIWLAAVKLEAENGEHGRAELLLSRARENADTAKVWIKSAVLERQLGKITEAVQLLDQGLEKYPTADKLWMIRGQILVDRGDNQKARENYVKALKSCPKSVPLWILYSRLEDKAGLLVKARSLLERGRILNPKTPELWCVSRIFFSFFCETFLDVGQNGLCIHQYFIHFIFLGWNRYALSFAETTLKQARF